MTIAYPDLSNRFAGDTVQEIVKAPSAKKIRRKILDLAYQTKSPHIGSAFSCVELLITLYFKTMRIFPRDPRNQARDRFILSKGHACTALYAVLAERGFMDENTLKGFAVDGGTLEQHPFMDLSKGIEISSGSLGHGLSISAGIALAGRKGRGTYRVYTLLSDGELNEGSIWEAAMFASHHRLDNLTAIVDYNKMQALGFTKDIINLEPLAARWESFGWKAIEIDGHDLQQTTEALGNLPLQASRPSVIIAHTIKGKGVSFMENNLLWHYRTPDEKEYKMAIKELQD